ncbi:MAG: hypothetical protein M2R45_00163 [Verrucomicrobia subdivision 3 bacterium]|nr:hypothetical protein [Limisphaerales bacterium]MCS1412377.1 hypothetical protein [Limisphaerales bacterium]
MSFIRLLAVGKGIDAKGVGENPFKPVDRGLMADLGSESWESPEFSQGEALKPTDPVSDQRSGWGLRWTRSWLRKRIVEGACRNPLSLEGFEVKRNDLWESDWEVRVAESKCLEFEPGSVQVSRRSSFGGWLWGCFRFWSRKRQ